MLALIDPVIDTLQFVRRAKTEAKQSQKAPVAVLVITAPDSLHAALRAGDADLRDAGSVEDITVEAGTELGCAVTLA